jgi:16S rRNA (uracil1498-N3)-methyltransferase
MPEFYPDKPGFEQINPPVKRNEFMAERFFLSQPPDSHNTVQLEDDQAHHLVRVMRANPGDAVVLFDGLGTEYKATVKEVSKKRVTLAVESASRVDDPNQPEIIVACALPKGDRQKFLVEKLVELGANQLIPLKTSRSVSEATSKAIERIRKQVIEASKQCRRNWLMQIDDQATIGSLLSKFDSFDGHRVVADPYASGNDLPVKDTACVIAIGPEGGFSETESQLFVEGGWSKVCFSPNVLRIETAAVAAVAIARQSKHQKSFF